MSFPLEKKFVCAYEYIQNQPKDGPFRPSEIKKLQYYKYYKQAKEGDVNCPRPGLLDFVGKAKWDAWNEVKGMDPEVAMDHYVKLLIEDLDEFIREGPGNKDEANIVVEKLRA